MSTITGLGGGWNAPGCEGPVLCCRPGPARAPAGTHTGVTTAPARPELPGPCNHPQLPFLRGPSAKVAPDLTSRLTPPGPALLVRPGSQASLHLQQATEVGAGRSALAAPTLRARPIAAPQPHAMEAAMPAGTGRDYNSQQPMRDRGLLRPYGSC